MATRRTVRIFVWGMAALAAAILGLALWERNLGPHGASLADFGAPFKLASSKGGELDSDTLKGKPYGIFFGFTHCPEVCPTTLSDMSVAMNELGETAKDFRLVFITVDPEKDTAPILANYLSSFDARIEGLAPTLDQLPALARAFHVYYKKVPTSDGDYTMDHTAVLFLFDKQANLASTVSFDEDKATRLAKLKKLLAAE